MGNALIVGAALLLGCGHSGTALEPGTRHIYRVLFIGNSLTYVNDLPGTVARLGGMADVIINVKTVALPDFAVIDHASGMSNAVETIRSGNWDYVVLQQGPTTTEIGPPGYGVAGGGGASTAAMRSSTSARSCSHTFGALSLINSGATQRLVVAT